MYATMLVRKYQCFGLKPRIAYFLPFVPVCYSITQYVCTYNVRMTFHTSTFLTKIQNRINKKSLKETSKNFVRGPAKSILEINF